jgi:hypothetical protein
MMLRAEDQPASHASHAHDALPVSNPHLLSSSSAASCSSCTYSLSARRVTTLTAAPRKKAAFLEPTPKKEMSLLR